MKVVGVMKGQGKGKCWGGGICTCGLVVTKVGGVTTDVIRKLETVGVCKVTRVGLIHW